MSHARRIALRIEPRTSSVPVVQTTSTLGRPNSLQRPSGLSHPAEATPAACLGSGLRSTPRWRISSLAALIPTDTEVHSQPRFAPDSLQRSLFNIAHFGKLLYQSEEL